MTAENIPGSAKFWSSQPGMVMRAQRCETVLVSTPSFFGLRQVFHACCGGRSQFGICLGGKRGDCRNRRSATKPDALSIATWLRGMNGHPAASAVGQNQEASGGTGMCVWKMLLGGSHVLTLMRRHSVQWNHALQLRLSLWPRASGSCVTILVCP